MAHWINVTAIRLSSSLQADLADTHRMPEVGCANCLGRTLVPLHSVAQAQIGARQTVDAGR